jgi:hypothetical protein
MCETKVTNKNKILGLNLDSLLMNIPNENNFTFIITQTNMNFRNEKK